MRANMRCTLVAWLSPGTTSAGQLKGNRPVSSTYSVTPHDLQPAEACRQRARRTQAGREGCWLADARHSLLCNPPPLICQMLST